MAEATEAYKTLVEGAGAEFIGVRGNDVRFREPETGAVLSLYTFALRSIKDVRLALKSVREPVAPFDPPLPTEKGSMGCFPRLRRFSSGFEIGFFAFYFVVFVPSVHATPNKIAATKRPSAFGPENVLLYQLDAIGKDVIVIYRVVISRLRSGYQKVTPEFQAQGMR